MEKDFLDEYSGQSTDELISLSEKYSVDSLVLAFEVALHRKLEKNSANKFTEAEMTILAVEAMEREINNGGWSQFFINSSKIYANILEESLMNINCKKAASIAKKAISILKISGEINEES